MKQPIVIKLGGTSATDSSVVATLGAELTKLTERGLIVHGGGKEVSALSERLGYVPVFENGIRMTSDEEMDLVEMVLAGLANKRLVRTLLTAGVRASGLSGSDGAMVVGESIRTANGTPSRTGRVAAVDPAPIVALWDSGFLPIVAPPSMTRDGVSLNINADDVAFAIAGAVNAAALIFLSDVAGVRIGGEIVHTLGARAVAAAIGAGEISGGMIPKVQNALTALESGVERVVIGQYEQAGDLTNLMEGSAGTSIQAQGGDQ